MTCLVLTNPTKPEVGVQKVRILCVAICTHTYSKQTNKSKPIVITSVIFGLVTFNNQPTEYLCVCFQKESEIGGNRPDNSNWSDTKWLISK